MKLGSSLVADEHGRVRSRLVGARAAEIAVLTRSGERVCVVSSGAIALGLPLLGLTARPRSTPRLQAASAVGQVRLQLAWAHALRRRGVEAAQVLLTASELADRTAYVNVRNALDALQRLGAVPVVNENDAVATDEITFGDNDALAAQVAVLTRARLLVLLTEVDGVYTTHPALPGAEPVATGDEAALAEIGPGTAHGRGGMSSKIAAARIASAAGIATVIASGRRKDAIAAALAGEPRGTRFTPDTAPASAFKLWLRHAKPVAGRLVVDDGARRALVEQGRSLLAVGVVACEGTFRPGDAVELAGEDGTAFAKGLVEAGADELRGRARGVEAVHRDRLVLYDAAGTSSPASGRVTAPSDADDTSAAYFASTPTE